MLKVDFLVILFFLLLSFFFLTFGVWKKVWLLVFLSAIFLFSTSAFIMDSGVEVVNGYSTAWDANYSSYANETVSCVGGSYDACCEHDVNTTQTGSEVISYSYASIGRDYEMSLVTIFALLGIYLLYLSLVEWRGKSQVGY